MIRHAAQFFKRCLFRIYKHLPIPVRWRISHLLGSKFLVGMVFLVRRNETVLLVKHSYQQRWALPGGWLEHGEAIEEGARREIREEFGVQVKELRIVKTVASKAKPAVDVVLACDLAGEPKADQVEVDELRFFGLEALPVEMIVSHRAYIEELGRVSRDGTNPAPNAAGAGVNSP